MNLRNRISLASVWHIIHPEVLCLILVIATAGGVLAERPSISENDWPWWRGHGQDGVAVGDQQPPTQWSPTENVRWRLPIVGRGHGSPTVFADQVFLATADSSKEEQSVVSVDRETGKLNWQTVVHTGGFANKSRNKLNKKASLASSSVATDGEKLFINFMNDDALWTTALDLNGEILWQKRISDYVLHQGYGASPAIFGALVIVSADNKSGGVVVGLNRNTGKVLWKQDRPSKPNYASPIILNAAGRDQLILSGGDLVTSLDPLTGEKIWEIEGATTECVTSAVTDGDHVFTSGGYPTNHVSAVKADGSGEIVWQNKSRVYVPSMLQRDGYLYATLDAGIAACFRCRDGKEMWKKRLGGTFSSSPVMVGDLVYAANEAGQTFLFKASPDSFQKVAENKLGDSVFSTPAICGSRIYTRVAHFENDQRQEYLYCLGN
ncbi:PQQ-binding-like beta-propeller repeat protein [bacterium]|nr:PQQ-binding-like beta-propeller repeat protein [bacterium]